MLQLPCMLVCRLLLCVLAYETAGAASTRSSLRPLCLREQTKKQNSGRSCREIAKSYSVVIPAQAGIQYSRDSSDGIERPRRTGSSACAEDDSGECGDSVAQRSPHSI